MKDWFLKTFVYRYHTDWVYDADDLSMLPNNFEMKRWFKENISSNRRGKQLREYTYGQSGELYARIIFCFRDEEDLMAFKIMWS